MKSSAVHVLNEMKCNFAKQGGAGVDCDGMRHAKSRSACVECDAMQLATLSVMEFNMQSQTVHVTEAK